MAKAQRTQFAHDSHPTQMPSYDLIAKFYSKHSSAQAHSSSLQPYDFRNQTPKQQQAPKPTAQLHQLHSKPYNAFILASGYAGSWRGQKQLLGRVRSSKLSTATVHKGSLLQPNPAQILAAIAVLKQSAVQAAIFATDSLTDQQRIS